MNLVVLTALALVRSHLSSSKKNKRSIIKEQVGGFSSQSHFLTIVHFIVEKIYCFFLNLICQNSSHYLLYFFHLSFLNKSLTWLWFAS